MKVPQQFMFKNSLFEDGYTTTDILKECEAFQFRRSDIVISTFPRTGTTVTQEIIWQVLNHETIEKDVKYSALYQRYCFLEYRTPDGYPSSTCTREKLVDFDHAEPRLIKTHLPYYLLRHNLEKAKPRIIIVFRNPKDTAVSNYHFSKLFGYDQTWSEYCEQFMKGETVTGNYFDNCLEWWSLRDQENVLILRYEDIIRQKHQQIRRIAGFLKKDLTQEQVEIIAHNTAFASMSKNENVNSVIGAGGKLLRKGRSGTWKDTLTVAQNEAMDRVIESKFDGTDLTFDYS